ncbi:HlyD family type I secretion periplasmic adaptor subunit [Roseobacter sp. HKCCD9010]|uniref:HlyD family type I secretion periplasmic adaptor subunit n=1 Tax=unclassified Roseobacter TaxID=196798 RepID=UPI001491C1AE|nr:MULTISPECIES: HlyD family type I secretion periplasmic adaptor subunit [unclassified Roseobacter]MBF9051756.1 HlyD family type I secretion periplasmic adaptor subunit [Rhodobacterales bacterium HKCCD4356]NNV13749.1 HlyD family type I secretion periplasmic adaptor subunit [Roseobacter sp. HKCCD7357]NNV17774.1 HlyD family type I secretion periplasmic adaptor subunit [Roseobacter sp. HKCCD8768]NNV27381.1 HlyD family type I secretion periplasmic adaptor subunit [Roseobacter sp. HKCCD8192]NNV315
MDRNDLDALADDREARVHIRESLLLIVVLVAMLAAVAWAVVAKVEDVTHVPGLVVPLGDLQQITADNDGVISEIFVSEGDIVEAGAALIELEIVTQSSQFDREQQRVLALQARIARLTAETGDEPLSFTPELEANAIQFVESERALYVARMQEHEADIAALMQRLDQNHRDRVEVMRDLTVARRASERLNEQLAIMTPLVDAGVEPETSLVDLQRQEEAQISRRSRAEAALGQLDADATEINEIARAVETGFRANAFQDLTAATEELNSLRRSLTTGESLTARTALRAVDRGVVNTLHHQTIGATVRAGENLVEIGPFDDHLQVEAYIAHRYIGLIKLNQPVRVQLTAYDVTRYGALDGRITRISPNADRLDGREPPEMFVAVIQTDGAILDAGGEQVRILPGMIAEIDIRAGESSVIDYLLEPIMGLFP